MKHTMSWIVWMLGILVLCATGCRQEDTDEAFSEEEISFGGLRVAALTRGIVEDGTQLESVKVAGRMQDASTSSSANVFTEDWITLTYSNNAWTYSPVQRWKGNQQYWFAAVYPEMPSGGEFSTDGTITVPGFVSTGQNDLLCNVVGVDTSQSYDAKVTLTPRHVQAKVAFIIHNKTTDASLTVSNLKIEAMCRKGTVTVTPDDIRWTHDADSKEDVGFALGEATTLAKDASLTTDPQLVIPSERGEDGAYVADGYTVSFDATPEGSATVHLEVPLKTTLEAGKSYQFTMNVLGGNVSLSISYESWKDYYQTLSNDKSDEELTAALALNDYFAEYDAKYVDLVNHKVEFYTELPKFEYRSVLKDEDSEYFSLDSLVKAGITAETIFTDEAGNKYRIPVKNDFVLLAPDAVNAGNMTNNNLNICDIYQNGFVDRYVADDGTAALGFGQFKPFENTQSEKSWTLYASRFIGSSEQAVYKYDYQYDNNRVEIWIKGVATYRTIDWEVYSSGDFWKDNYVKLVFPFTSSYRDDQNNQQSGKNKPKPCSYHLTMTKYSNKASYALRISDNILATDYYTYYSERMPIRFVKVKE